MAGSYFKERFVWAVKIQPLNILNQLPVFVCAVYGLWGNDSSRANSQHQSGHHCRRFTSHGDDSCSLADLREVCARVTLLTSCSRGGQGQSIYCLQMESLTLPNISPWPLLFFIAPVSAPIQQVYGCGSMIFILALV